MSQAPPPGQPGFPDPASYPSPPGPYAQPMPAKEGRSWWPWIVGGLGLLVVMPCLCCGGCMVVIGSFKEITISNGEHLGGSPMNVRFNYAFANDGSHGPP